jgi:hypothetical protein
MGKKGLNFTLYSLTSHQVVGGNGTVNTDRKVRLQLFYPYRSTFRNKNPGHLEVKTETHFYYTIGLPVVGG